MGRALCTTLVFGSEASRTISRVAAGPPPHYDRSSSHESRGGFAASARTSREAAALEPAGDSPPALGDSWPPPPLGESGVGYFWGPWILSTAPPFRRPALGARPIRFP